MIKTIRVGWIFLIIVFSLLVSGRVVLASTWFEYPTNPIYDPVPSAEKAYYPSIVKMGASDYRMWYQSNSTAGNTTVAYATSADGISWTKVTNAVSGLLTDNAGHPHVEYFNGQFEIWYWNAATPYGNIAMHHAVSVDGITWTNDSAITGNLTTTPTGLWNSGIYGAVDVIFNDSPTNTGTNPFDYKYAMYFDATSGGYEQIALGYSVDGVAWTLYGTGPVVPKGPAGAWDSGYVAIGSTVIKGTFWTMWYSGGISSSNEGIGCATSIDGLEWVKCPNNPVMSKTDGVAWRNSRTYTPKIIRDGNLYKMWFTGRDIATGNYAIGYATNEPLSVSGNLYLRKKSSGEATLPTNGTNLVLDNESILNLASTVNTASGGTIVIADVTATLANFTSGDLTTVDLSVPKNVGGKSITVGKAIKLSSGSNGVATNLTNSNLANVHVAIPDATTVLAPSGWDGIIVPPKTGTTVGDTAPPGFSIGTAIDVGSPTEVLLFDKPVVLTLSGVSGSVGYKPAGSTTWTQITTTCTGTYSAPTLVASAFPGECFITNGTDTKILTYHFTTFGSLTEGTSVAPGATVTPPSNTLTIFEQVNNDSGGKAGFADFSLFVDGNHFTSGESRNLAPGVYTVTETNIPGYTVNFTGDCDANGKVTVGGINTRNVVCTVVNNDIGVPTTTLVPPLIDIIKTPSPLAMPAGPGPVTYTYTVTNIGTVPMTDITLLGDTCKPIMFVSGDTNNDSKLDVGEKWVYSCTMELTETTRNTVVAIGQANGLTATDITSAIVVVGASILPPLIHVVKIPAPVTLPLGGGTEIYTMTVTNPGEVALSEVSLVDDKCGPVRYVSGDVNSDSKLDPGEIWVYVCQTNLTQTTVNTVAATGLANGLVATDFSIATVVVAAPNFPNAGTSFPDTGNASTFGQQVKQIAVNIRNGNSGNNVKILQQFLISQNKGPSAQVLNKVGATGYFGTLTQRALAEFQAKVGINPASGNFGPITRAYLDEH